MVSGENLIFSFPQVTSDIIILKRVFLKRKNIFQPSMVAHFNNPNYLGGRDWEDHGSRLA
jgi:hypothetical protein